MYIYGNQNQLRLNVLRNIGKSDKLWKTAFSTMCSPPNDVYRRQRRFCQHFFTCQVNKNSYLNFIEPFLRRWHNFFSFQKNLNLLSVWALWKYCSVQRGRRHVSGSGKREQHDFPMEILFTPLPRWNGKLINSFFFHQNLETWSIISRIMFSPQNYKYLRKKTCKYIS